MLNIISLFSDSEHRAREKNRETNCRRKKAKNKKVHEEKEKQNLEKED